MYSKTGVSRTVLGGGGRERFRATDLGEGENMMQCLC